MLVLLAYGISVAGQAGAQQVTYRGFVDTGLTLYPLEAPNDSTQAVADALVRVEPSVEFGRALSITSSFDARFDTHDQTAWSGGIKFWDRTLQRPMFALRTLALTFVRGPFTIEAGKQFVRWGQSDILSPTDQFTSRDYLTPVNNEALAPTAARVTVANQSRSLEFVYAPRMTPSRIPLLDQRWIGLQATSVGLPLENGNNAIPDRPLWGLRWHHAASRVEYSATFFKGYHHLPLLDVVPTPSADALIVSRRYPSIQAWGGDAVAPLRGLTLRAEAAWRESRNEDTDNYGLWVVQAERQQASWLLLGGYVGEWLSEDRDAFGYAPDRGLARSIVARASHTSESSRTFLIEAVVRRNLDGLYLKSEYSRPIGSAMRATVQFLLIRGDIEDFFGQYRRNSWALTRARYSF
jgi:hypothetical protein